MGSPNIAMSCSAFSVGGVDGDVAYSFVRQKGASRVHQSGLASIYQPQQQHLATRIAESKLARPFGAGEHTIVSSSAAALLLEQRSQAANYAAGGPVEISVVIGVVVIGVLALKYILLFSLLACKAGGCLVSRPRPGAAGKQGGGKRAPSSKQRRANKASGGAHTSPGSSVRR